jgi:hypothetical protein
VVIPKDTATDAPDHRSVAMDDRFEDGHLPSGHVAIQELSVGQAAERTDLEDGLEVLGRRVHPDVLTCQPHQFSSPLSSYYLDEGSFIHNFSTAPDFSAAS